MKDYLMNQKLETIGPCVLDWICIIFVFEISRLVLNIQHCKGVNVSF